MRPGNAFALIELERRPHTWRADVPFVAIALIAGAVILFLGRSLTFWQDEWRSITFDGGLLDYFRPIEQHWSTFPLLLYRGTFRYVELRSYVPYLTEVVALHLVAVAGAYVLMRNRVGPLVATLVAVPLLFLGSGAENLFWAFQTGLVGSVMFGVWALVALERPGRHAILVASLLLLASLMASGMGLYFLVIAGVRTLLEPRFRSRALAVVPPFVVYLVWFVLVGRDQIEGRLYLELGTVRFLVRGVLYAAQRTSGVDHLPDGPVWGLLLFIGIASLVAYRIIRRRTPALAAACLLGVIAMYASIAFARLHRDPGYDHALSSRYVYVAAFLLVLAVVDLLPERGSWSKRTMSFRAVAPVALLIALAWATVANLDDLRDDRNGFQRAADVTRAFVALAVARGHEPWVDRDVPRDWMPSVAQLERLVERHGSPVRDELFPGVVEAPDASAREQALLRLIGDGFRIEGPRDGSGIVRVNLAVANDAALAKVGSCARAHLDTHAAMWLLDLPARARVRVITATRLAGRVFLAHEGGPSRGLFPQFESGLAEDVVIPDVGDARLWTLGVDSPLSPAVITACVLLPADARPARPPVVVVRRQE